MSLEYNIPKIIQSMRKQPQSVIDAQGGYEKYWHNKFKKFTEVLIFYQVCEPFF